MLIPFDGNDAGSGLGVLTSSWCHVTSADKTTTLWSETELISFLPNTFLQKKIKIQLIILFFLMNITYRINVNQG